MSQLSEFFAWCEGFCENIDKEPNAKQWKTLRAKLSDMAKLTSNGADDFAAAPAQPSLKSNAGATVVQLPVQPKIPNTKPAWLAAFTAALLEQGCDLESAKEFAKDVQWNKDIDPKESAQETFNQFVKPGSASG